MAENKQARITVSNRQSGTSHQTSVWLMLGRRRLLGGQSETVKAAKWVVPEVRSSDEGAWLV